MTYDYRLGRFGIHVLHLKDPTMALWWGAHYVNKGGALDRGVLVAVGRWALFVGRAKKEDGHG